MTAVDAKALFQQATEVAVSAYAPYSGFGVGAALLAKSGQVYVAVNVENAAYASTICAERAAVAAAVAAGERNFKAIAIAAANGSPISPCGACRQVLSEFGVSIDVVTTGLDGLRTESLEFLLPRPFHL